MLANGQDGTCYDPAQPPPNVPAQLALTCCAGECIAARDSVGRDCRLQRDRP